MLNTSTKLQICPRYHFGKSSETPKDHRTLVLFSGFPKDGHTAWFGVLTKKLEAHCKQLLMKALFSSFPTNDDNAWFDAQNKKKIIKVTSH